MAKEFGTEFVEAPFLLCGPSFMWLACCLFMLAFFL